MTTLYGKPSAPDVDGESATHDVPDPGLTGDSITLNVFRGTPGGDQGDVSYQVPAVTGMVVLDAIHYIQHNLDTDLAVRWNCKAAKCGSCSAEINGRPGLMCKTRIDDLPAGPITVGPMKAFPLIKDLVSDVSLELRINKEIPPFTAAPDDGTHGASSRLTSTDLRVPQVHRVLPVPGRLPHPPRPTVCPTVLRTALLRPRGRPGDAPDGHASTASNRSPTRAASATATSPSAARGVPGHIHITDNAIIPLKERVVDKHWDPVRWVGRKVFGSRDNDTQPPAKGAVG